MIQDFDATNVQHVREILDEITYNDHYAFLVREREVQWPGSTVVGIELQVQRIDAITGKKGIGYGGSRWLSSHTSKSDLVRIAFGAILSYNEHETREFFRYRGRQVFGPHGDIDALWVAADSTDFKER